MRYIPFAIAVLLTIGMIPTRLSGPGLVLFIIPFTAAVVLGHLAFKRKPEKESKDAAEASE